MILFYAGLSDEELVHLYDSVTKTDFEQTLIDRLKKLIKENKRLKQDLDEALSKIEAMGGDTYYD